MASVTDSHSPASGASPLGRDAAFVRAGIDLELSDKTTSDMSFHGQMGITSIALTGSLAVDLPDIYSGMKAAAGLDPISRAQQTRQ